MQRRGDLLAWLNAPTGERGIRFAMDDGTWEETSWEHVAGLVHDAARQIAAHRRSPDGVVVIAMPGGPEFVALFFGALLAGNVPCPIAPPNPLQDPIAYTDHVASLLRVADPELVVTSPHFLDLVEQAHTSAGLSGGPPPQVLGLRADNGEAAAGPRADLALLQFTSGSSGTPRAARVSWRNLQSNIELLAEWTFADVERDSLATWLPHYHDMGLIGCILSCAVFQVDLWVLRPEQFVRRPTRWLECFGEHGVTIGAAPTFGFQHVLRRVRPEHLGGMDFSSWRAAVVGAERIDAGVLSRFTELLEPFGFKPQTFVPGYGLAEATLLVTGRCADTPAPAVKLDTSRLVLGEPVTVTDRAEVGDAAAVGDGVGWLVSCGWARRGVGVTVLDEADRPLPEGHLGDLFVTGRCVVDGYHGGDEVGSAKFVDGGVRTGDAGVVLDGELYIMGRIGDSVKVRGRQVYAEDLEARLGRVEGVDPRRCAVFTGPDVVVALVEKAEGDWVPRAIRALRGAVGDEIRVEVLFGRPGAIARTSSGKPRRRVMWRSYMDGSLRAKPAGTAADPGLVPALEAT